MNKLYTDGSNSLRTGFCGWAVTGKIGDRNISVCGWDLGTNQKAELLAIIKAIYMAPISEPTEIISDSMYAIQCMTDFRKKWEENHFLSSTGQEVKNIDIIKEGHKLLDKKPLIKFTHVRGHRGVEGNERADHLAKYARQLAEGVEGLALDENTMVFKPKGK